MENKNKSCPYKKLSVLYNSCLQTFGSRLVEPTWCTNFLNMFIAFLYMFRATICQSSGENTVPMRHLVLVTLKQVDSLKSPHNIERRNFTECFNRSVTLARLCTSSLGMVEDRNM